MRLPSLLLVSFPFLLIAEMQAQNKPLDVYALLKLNRISEPRVSPDGRFVAYTVQTVDLDKNTKPPQIWFVAVDGRAPQQITREGTINERPRWSPDSKQIAYISNRSGTSQVWLMDPEGGNARQVTNLSTEASGVTFSPDGKNLVFISEVYPDCPDEDCNKKHLDEENASKVKARVYTSLLYRHWKDFQGKRRKHLMVVAVGGGAVKDLTPGTRDVPPFSLGGPDDYAIAPDGNEVCYAMNPDENPAISTNSELFGVPIGGGEAKKITVNPAADNSPVYSPDGRYIAFRAQQRAGYESDRCRLVVLDGSKAHTTVLTEGLDRNVTGLTWSNDSKRIFFTTEDRGLVNLQLISVTGGASRVIIPGGGHVDDVQFSADGKTMIYTLMSGSHPTEIFKASSGGGAAVALTKMNDALLAEYAITPQEDFTVQGAEGARVHSFLLKPPGFV